MLPAISEFFGTTFTDSLNKFLQPTYVIISALFLLLNLLFIVPALPAQQISSADITTKAFIGIPVILVLSYIFLSLNTFTLKVMNGEAWIDTLLGRICIHFQQQKRDRQQKTSNTFDDVRKRVANIEHITSFPEEASLIAPTALGNVLNATSSYIWNHYGIDMVALWPHMNTVIGTDTTLSSSVTNEKATLDFLVNFSFILIVFAIELLLTTFLYTHQFGKNILWILLPLALSYVIYQAAVIQARTWGDVVQEAFDLHRSDLKKSLGLRDFTSQQDEREVWQKVSKWLLGGKEGENADDCFAGQPTPSTPSVTCSANIKVDVQTILVTGPTHHDLKQILYSLFISNVDTSDKQGTLQVAFILISDTQVPKIHFKPCHINHLPSDVTAENQIISSHDPNNPDGLLWTIKGLQYNGAAVIRYSLPMKKQK